MRVFGWDETVNSCDCCGKVELSGTFAVETDDGAIIHYGSVCVKRATGVKNPTKAANDYLAERRAAAKRAIEQTDEYRAYRAVLNGANYRVDRGQEQIGDSRDAIKAAGAALRIVEQRINTDWRI